MTNKRYEQIMSEGKRRLNLWLQNDTFENMTCYYSMIRFNMSIGLCGYPFLKETWMKAEDFTKFITDDEYYDPKYDQIMSELFNIGNNQADIKKTLKSKG